MTSENIYEELILLFKRFVTVCLAVLLMAGAMFVAMPGAQAAEEEDDIRTLLDTFPMKGISYRYADNNTNRNSYVWFSPALLLQDSRVFSGEMAKASVALAMAAYTESDVDGLLANMGFTTYENNEVYLRSNDLTLSDNDRVAYTIAYQDVTHPVSGEVFRIYCVPIKGTSANAEWFSDFNMGTGAEHEGFKTASTEVYDALNATFAADGMDADHRIVWLTGHSRGAACANLISAWLTKDSPYARAEHIFGYTYACPGVSVSADKNLRNIYNFNNPGDLVTMLPLSEWGFDRNGQTIILDTSDEQMNNVRLQFKNTTGAVYAAETTDEEFKTVLLGLFGGSREAFNRNPAMKLTLSWVAYLMGGKNDVTVPELLVKNGVDVSTTVAANIAERNLISTVNNLNWAYSKYTELYQWVEESYAAASTMTESEFKSFLSGNYAKLANLKKETGLEITCAADFLSAKTVLNQLSSEVNSLVSVMEAAINLVVNEKGNVVDAIVHGHTQSAYTVWINSLYYGHRGWYNNPDVQTLTIDCNTLNIGNECFYGCQNLAALTLPNEQVVLGRYSFGNCKGLRTVTLPADYDFVNDPFRASSSSEHTNGVTTICYTYGKNGVVLDRESSSNSARYYGKSLEYASRNSIQTLDFADGITHIGNYLAYCCSALKTVNIPDTVTTIGERSFYSCTALTGVRLHEGLVSLGAYAFQGCDSLTGVTIPKSMETIGNYAFHECSGMVELTIPDTTVKLGTYCFGNCKGLRTVTLPVDYDFSSNPFAANSGSDHTNGVTTIHYTFGQTGIMTDRVGNTNNLLSHNRTLEHASRNSIQSIDFEDGITHVGNYLFYYGSTTLNQINLPNSLQTIGSYAFNDCTALSSIDFNEGLVSLGDHAFEGCKSFPALPEFPDSLTTVGGSAFADCDGLQELTIPESVTSIGNRAFYGCDNLRELTIPDIKLTIGSNAFGNCKGLRTVTLPVDYDTTGNPFGSNYTNERTDGVTHIYYTVGQTGVMTDRVSASNNTLSANRTLEYASKDSIQSINFEEGITHIGNYLFYYGGAALTEVNLPDSLQTIGSYAFKDCTALTGIKLNEGLVSLGDHAFDGCIGFAQLPVFPASLKTIGNYGFANCDGLTSVTVPTTVTSIGDYGFYGCDNVAELTLPNTQLSLGTYAFGNMKALRTVTLPVDYDFSYNPFSSNYTNEHTDGVTTIHFTVGQTGAMTNRLNNGNSLFSHNKTLVYQSRNSVQTIDFEEGITHIGSYFISSGSDTLTSVTLPSTLKTIGERSFYACKNLQGVVLPEGLTTIGSYAFYDCDSFTALPTLPSTLTTIGNYGFYGCDSMAELTLPDQKIALGTYAFGNCKALRTVTLPVDYDITNNPFGGSYTSERTDGVTTIHFTCGESGILPDRTTNSNYVDYYGKTLEYISRDSIQTMNFAEGVTHIGKNFIYSGSTALQTVNFPKTLQSIGSRAFTGCTANGTVTFAGNAPTIAADAFKDTTATCRYPAWDDSWTADVMQNYGGTLTWIPYRNDLKLNVNGFTLSFEDEVLVNAYYTIEDVADVSKHGVLVFYTMPQELRVDLADVVYDATVADAEVNRFMASTDGIAAKNMGDTHYYVAYAIRGDGECFYSDVYDYSPKKYAMNMLGKTSTTDKQKALCVAMLNYGAAAQEYFGHRADDLMNADLTSEQKALVVGYDSSFFTGAVAADPAKTGAFVSTDAGFKSYGVTVSFEGAFAINYYLKPNAQVDGEMKLYLWTAETYASVSQLTADNASSVITMEQRPDYYWTQVSGIPAKMIDKTYYVAGVYTDAQGNTCCTGVIAYSLSRYCMNNASGKMGQLAQATAMYGYYAENYFA